MKSKQQACGCKSRLLPSVNLSIHRLRLQSMKQGKQTSALYAFRKKQTRLWLTYMLYTNKAMQCNAMQSHYTVVYPYPVQSKSGRNKLQALSILIIKSDAIGIYSTRPFFCVVGAVTRTTRLKERTAPGRLSSSCSFPPS